MAIGKTGERAIRSRESGQSMAGDGKCPLRINVSHFRKNRDLFIKMYLLSQALLLN